MTQRALLVLAVLTGRHDLAVAESASVEVARQLYQDKKLPDAQAAFEKIATAEPKNAEVAFYLGRIALSRNDLESAVTWLQKATSVAPEKSVYFNALGEAYGMSAERAGVLSKFGLARKCLAAWDKAVALDPENIAARVNRVEFYRHAPGVVGGGMDKAYAEAGRIRQLDPPRGAEVLIDLYISDKKYTEAFALCDDAIKAYPDKKTPLYQLGRLVAITGQQLDRGEAALTEYLRYAPVDNEPPHFAAHWRLGMIHEKKGDKKSARTEYETALSLRPRFAPAQDSLKNLK